jgi:RNA polymerase sigma-70 factor (ECF subfamily)
MMESREPNRMSLEDIVRKCLEGDRRGQQTLFTHYRSKVTNLVYRFLGPRFDVDEVVQEVFVSLFESLQGFRGLSSLDTWVYRLCMKVCTDQLRKKYRKRQLSIVHVEGGPEELTDPRSPSPQSALMERKELRQEIFGALEKLTVEKRQVVVLYEMDGKTLEEIADIVQAPVGTVKSRLFHGRNELKRHLRRYVES